MLKEMSFFFFWSGSIPKELKSGSLKQSMYILFSFPFLQKRNSLFFSWWHENETWLGKLKAKRVLTKKALTLHLLPSNFISCFTCFHVDFFHNIYWKFNDTCVKKWMSNFFNIGNQIYTNIFCSPSLKSIHFTAQLSFSRIKSTKKKLLLTGKKWLG